MVAPDGTRGIHRSSAAADARLAAVVSGHGRRGVPEYLFAGQRTIQIHVHPVRRPHLQDGLRQDAATAHRFRRGSFRGDHRGACGGGCPAVWRDRDGQGLADCRFRREACCAEDFTVQDDSLQRFDGRLHFQYATADSDTDGGLGRSQFQARLREGHSSPHHLQASRVCLQLCRRKFQGVAVLARCRHA